ncbi:MAG: hypothetical protein IM566_04230 [Pseudanabaena sp. M152S2SP2A07QC]|jgi:hypothetical protein|nr:hypothetical protein [Pseudanabaena sp. M109S1SP2A07QC]MCA6546631.1 hypothetical protein [Pseudanabaena sp. M152S2SP2A07QC]
MDINISCSPNEHIRIFINGNLAGEIAVNQLESHQNLVKEVKEARKLKALPRIVSSVVAQVFELRNFEDHVNTSEAKRQSAYTQGVVDGLNKIKIQSPNIPSIDILPRYDPTYEKGYKNGEFLINLLDSLDHT